MRGAGPPCRWPHGWPKHIGGHCVYELISICLCEFVGITIICIFNIIQIGNLVIYFPFDSFRHHKLILCQYLATYFIICNCTHEVYIGVCLGNLWGRDYLEDPDVGGNNFKMDLQEVGCGDMDWIDLAWDRDSWRAIVKVVMNFRVP